MQDHQLVLGLWALGHQSSTPREENKKQASPLSVDFAPYFSGFGVEGAEQQLRVPVVTSQESEKQLCPGCLRIHLVAL